MKRFYNTKKRKFNSIVYCITVVIIIDCLLINSIFVRLNNNINYVVKVKLDELTKYYLNKTIKKYLNTNTNDYIIINRDRNKILNIEVDNYSSNKLLNSVLSDLESELIKLEKGKINMYYNLEMIKGNNGIVILAPSGIMFNNSLLSNIGPKIPIKVNFLENIDAYVDVVVTNYGINNSLVKLYIVINIDEVIEVPINKKSKRQEYKFLISSKLITGEVPSFYGNTINKKSKIVKESVKK